MPVIYFRKFKIWWFFSKKKRILRQNIIFYFQFSHFVKILHSKKNTDQCTPQVTWHLVKPKPYNITIHNMIWQIMWVNCTSWWYCTFKNQRHKNFGTWRVPNDMKLEVKVTTIHGKLCNLPLFTTCARLFLQAFAFNLLLGFQVK